MHMSNDEQYPIGMDFGRTRAIARHDDPATSKAAAASVTDLTDKQRAVLEVIKGCLGVDGYTLIGYGFGIHAPDGVTDGEMMKVYLDVREGRVRIAKDSGSYVAAPAQSESGLRTRRAELVDRGLVKDTGRTRKTRLASGALSKAMTVWTVT